MTVLRLDFFLLSLSAVLLGSCYTFKGISIDPAVKTFSVRIFETATDNVPPTAGIDFTEKLKDKIRTETRLLLKTDNSDVEFSGKIAGFRVAPVAPKPGELIEKNRLEVVIAVNYTNNQDEKKGWATEKSFTYFAEFSNTTDLLTVQNTLLNDIIYPQLLEDVFNAAFNDW